VTWYFIIVVCIVCVLFVYEENVYVVSMLLTTGTVSQDLSITLTLHPSNNGGKVVSHSSVVLQCTVNKNILGHGNVEWYIRQGVNRYQLGTGSNIHSHLISASRYQLRMESQTSSAVVYRLTINSLLHINLPILTKSA